MEVKEKEVRTTRTEGVNATSEIRGVLVITMRLGDQENESPRIRGRIAAQIRNGSCCHLLSSFRPFSLFRGSNGLGFRGVIRRVGTSLDIASITGTSDIEPMTVIGSGGY